MATLSEYAIKYQERGGIVEKVVTKDRSEIGNHERGGRQPRFCWLILIFGSRGNPNLLRDVLLTMVVCLVGVLSLELVFDC